MIRLRYIVGPIWIATMLMIAACWPRESNAAEATYQCDHGATITQSTSQGESWLTMRTETGHIRVFGFHDFNKPAVDEFQRGKTRVTVYRQEDGSITDMMEGRGPNIYFHTRGSAVVLVCTEDMFQ